MRESLDKNLVLSDEEVNQILSDYEIAIPKQDQVYGRLGQKSPRVLALEAEAQQENHYH